MDWRKNVLFSLYNHIIARKRAIDLIESVDWPAPGSEDTELGVLMELEVGYGRDGSLRESSNLRPCA